MSWREALTPARMERVAIVAPSTRVREVLVAVADLGQVELDPPVGSERSAGPAALQLDALGTDRPQQLALAQHEIDPDQLVEMGRTDLLAGEAALQTLAADAMERNGVVALTGWSVGAALPALQRDLASMGGAVVRLTTPRGVDPPTLLQSRSRLHQQLSPLVETYGTVPYANVDPSVAAGIAYVAMFGMMFGDVGHGLMLVLAGLVLRAGRIRRLAGVAKSWPFVLGAGVAATAVGFLYGEFFGPTGLISPLWLSPTEEPVRLLVAGVAVGAVLLAAAYALGTVNRWREGGWSLALYAPSGMAGVALFLGLGGVVIGAYVGGGWGAWLVPLGAATWVTGLVLAFIGLLFNAGFSGTGVLQAVVELFDTVIQVGSNLISFARLAAFGLAHAALADLVWQATRSLGRGGPVDWLGAVLVFALGNAIAFTLEALVAGVQALRLEYYELFSRVFTTQGRPFRPWHIPTVRIPTAHVPDVPAQPAPQRLESRS